jgi:hypothetical protein
MQREPTFHVRARGRSDGNDSLLAWSVKREQLQEEQVQQLEQQPWQRMAEVATCKCNQVEDKAHKQQAKL